MADDPYKYFRIEARELCEQIGGGVLELERPFDAELLTRLLRFAHTLKGAARVVRQLDIAREAHALEEGLLRQREAATSATPEEVRALLSRLDQVNALVNALAAPAGSPSEPPAASVAQAAAEPEPTRAVEPERSRGAQRAAEVASTLRIDVEQMDALVRSAGNASQRIAALRRELSDFDRIASLSAALSDAMGPELARGVESASPARLRSLIRELATVSEQLGRGAIAAASEAEAELEAVREAAHQLRLLPVATLFPALERAVYDAAGELGKRATLETSGGEIRLEAHMLSALRDALLHVVRNAVAHGIERPSQRLRVAKPERGLVRLDVRRVGGRCVFRCSDDGRGIDVAAVSRRAVARGLVNESEAARLSQAELLRFLLRARLSTSEEVSEIAGRGIGLDAVQELVRGLRGELRLESEAGRGASLELDVPLSIAAIPALLVEVNAATVAIPLDAVAATARIAPSEVVRTERRDSVLFEGELVPFLPVQQALGLELGRESESNLCLVLLKAGHRRAAVSVDRVLSTANVVMRAIPRLVRAARFVAGAMLDAAGDAQIVLDSDALLELAYSAPRVERAAEPRPRPPILVIDDSLTTRMLEQSILESAGYEVELATSAEEGLEKARAKRYGLYIVDVEMPGMNGFDFVATTRADTQLSETPAILVSSRDGEEDKQRAARVGARAYIVKGEFEQQHLLSTIRSLVG